MEVYCKGRYFAVTGKRLASASSEVRECQAALDWLQGEVWKPVVKSVKAKGLESFASPDLATPQPPPPAASSSVYVSNTEWAVVGDDDDAILSRMKGATNWGKLGPVWDGGTVGYKSMSEAVQALAGNLTAYTRDAVTLERLLGRAPLVLSDAKWWARVDVRARCVEYALDGRRALDVQATVVRSRSGDYPYTDSGNASRFVDEFGAALKFVPEWNEWIVWDGRRWARDNGGVAATGSALKLVREVLPAATSAIQDDAKRTAYLKHVAASQAAGRVEAMVRLARVDLAVSASALDAKRGTLNVLNGTIDLHTGELRPHDASDLCTKLADVTFNPDAVAPTWVGFVERITRDAAGGARPDLTVYLQRAVGYAMVGQAVEQVMFVLHGGGDNGKSTLLEAVKRVLGEYAMTASPLLLMKTNNRAATEGVVHLQGKRFVVTSETSEGMAFDESEVKRLADCGRLRARPLYGREFEFSTSHTLFMDCNHLPTVRGDDRGIWRRLRRIPFDATITAEEKDTKLGDKLRAEGSGVLNWMLAGLAAWRTQGSCEPACVREAVEAYREDSDVLGRFLADCCDVGPDGWAESSPLYRVYVQWCKDNGLSFPLTAIMFGKKLKSRGFARGGESCCTRRSSAKGHCGLSLVESEHFDPKASHNWLTGT